MSLLSARSDATEIETSYRLSHRPSSIKTSRQFAKVNRLCKCVVKGGRETTSRDGRPRITRIASF